MLMKDIMKEKGIVDNNTVSVTCPHCKSSGLLDTNADKYIIPLFHDEHCIFIKTCRQLNINPYSDDEKVSKYIQENFEIKNLF